MRGQGPRLAVEEGAHALGRHGQIAVDDGQDAQAPRAQRIDRTSGVRQEGRVGLDMSVQPKAQPDHVRAQLGRRGGVGLGLGGSAQIQPDSVDPRLHAAPP